MVEHGLDPELELNLSKPESCLFFLPSITINTLCWLYGQYDHPLPAVGAAPPPPPAP
jgi:hypothetical protein